MKMRNPIVRSLRTWGLSAEEVTFMGVEKGKGKHKSGQKKILGYEKTLGYKNESFCGE